MTTYHITKYALTRGISTVDIPDMHVKDSGYVFAAVGNGGWQAFKTGRDAFLDRDDAVKDAAHRRDVEIIKLENRIRRLRSMEFA